MISVQDIFNPPKTDDMVWQFIEFLESEGHKHKFLKTCRLTEGQLKMYLEDMEPEMYPSIVCTRDMPVGHCWSILTERWMKVLEMNAMMMGGIRSYEKI